MDHSVRKGRLLLRPDLALLCVGALLALSACSAADCSCTRSTLVSACNSQLHEHKFESTCSEAPSIRESDNSSHALMRCAFFDVGQHGTSD